MGLVGLVLLVVLGVSIMSSYQTAAARIEAAVSQAIGHGLDSGQRPWIGGLDDRPSLTQTPSDTATQALAQEGGSFVPVYVISIDPTSLTVFSDNSAFVLIDSSLATEALERIRNLLSMQPAQSGSLTGLFADLRLFYHVEVTDTQSVTIALADASSLVDGTLQQAGISALIWFGAMLLLFLISLLLSRMALRPVAEAWERQRRFIADASHELKTPLTVILANNSLLLARPEKTVGEQEQWVNSTQAEAQRMDKLVRDLLLLAQTDGEEEHATAQAAAPRPVDLSALARRSLLQFEAVFFERGISLTTDIADDLVISGNEEQLERLIQILLDNASKYAAPPVAAAVAPAAGSPPQSPPQPPAQPPAAPPPAQPPQGKAAVHVELRPAAHAGRHLRLQVTNTGSPIDPAALPHLFERFYRADSAHSDSEGSGLGLSLAQAIVEAHRGTIEVSSTPTTGTTFTITL
jgi:signal transduction histidine kinase